MSFVRWQGGDSEGEVAKEIDTWTEGLRQITVPGGIHMEVDAPGTDPQKAKAICL